MGEECKDGRDQVSADPDRRQGTAANGKPSDTSVVTDDLRRGMRRLARHKPASPTPASTGSEAPSITYRRDLPRENARPRVYSPVPRGMVRLEQAAPGREESEPDMGSVYTVTTSVNTIESAEAVSESFREMICANDSPLCQRLAPICDPAEISKEDLVFMDVESTGFGNSALFLIGTMVWQDDCFEVRQFFARSYAEERAVITMFQKTLSSRKLLVTFNGKSFDLPYIRARSAATGVRFVEDPYHLDLLHVCRRIWKDQLPNCKLQTLESYICNRNRKGDIPGSEIPDAYHEYVRTDNAWQMVDVLKHNMLDLVTLADLMNRFPPLDDEE